MTTRITHNDLIELAGECSGGGYPWLAANGIEVDAMSTLLDSAIRTSIAKVACGDEMADIIADVAGQSFVLGWEAHAKFRAEVPA